MRNKFNIEGFSTALDFSITHRNVPVLKIIQLVETDEFYWAPTAKYTPKMVSGLIDNISGSIIMEL